MTKKQFESLEKAANTNNLFDWLYVNEAELSKEEITRIARELAYAMLNPLKVDDEASVKEMREEFLNELYDFYDTFGFDDDEEEE